MKAERKAKLVEQIEEILKTRHCDVGNSVIDSMGTVYVFSFVIKSGAVCFKAMQDIMRLDPQFTDVDIDFVEGEMWVNVTLDTER